MLLRALIQNNTNVTSDAGTISQEISVEALVTVLGLGLTTLIY